MTTISIDEEGKNPSHDMRAHKSLWIAVFLRGLEDAANAFSYWEPQREHKSMNCWEPLRWLYDERNEPGSFVWCCDLLELNPEGVRQKWRNNLRGWMRKAKSKRDIEEMEDAGNEETADED